MSFRFLGNKAQLLPEILSQICQVSNPISRPLVVDLFCGTATVSLGLRKMGYRVVANDLLTFCMRHAQTRLLVQGDLTLNGLAKYLCADLEAIPSDTLFRTNYTQVLALLNSLPGEEGFFFKEYSPAGQPSNGVMPRKYFTPANAKHIDAIRRTIRTWSAQNWITEVEESVLLHNLMLAVNQVANTAGTYGHFLSTWTTTAQQPLHLIPTVFSDDPPDHQVIQGDASETASHFPADVYYLDPPYTKRQYAAYYHILETIACQDEPALIGKSGLRPWREKASDFCHKRYAAQALSRVINHIDARYIFVSYSEDGHIPHDDMLDLLSVRGDVTSIEISYHRYLSSRTGRGKTLKERLYQVKVR